VTPDEQDWYDERAAILEHEAGYTRAGAERLAREMLEQRRLVGAQVEMPL